MAARASCFPGSWQGLVGSRVSTSPEREVPEAHEDRKPSGLVFMAARASCFPGSWQGSWEAASVQARNVKFLKPMKTESPQAWLHGFTSFMFSWLFGRGPWEAGSVQARNVKFLKPMKTESHQAWSSWLNVLHVSWLFGRGRGKPRQHEPDEDRKPSGVASWLHELHVFLALWQGPVGSRVSTS
jgi:hypothetical protein